MSRTRSIVETSEISTAKKSHNCQANANHRISMGDIRLGIRKNRATEYYCRNCALKIIDRGLEHLSNLKSNFGE